MSSRNANAPTVAIFLLRHAVWVSPAARKEWFQAALGELSHVQGRPAALSWALGCTLVSYTERICIMLNSLNKLPRWLLSVEMAVCLIPLAWLFIAAFALTARGIVPLENGILVASAALLGPIGLAATLRIVLSGGSVGRLTATVMGLLAAWTVLACTAHVYHDGSPFAEWWRDFVLIALLPTWAVVHLLQINAERRATSAMV